MDERKFEYIRAKLEEASKIAAQGISSYNKKENDLFGLRNVISRMKMYYGEQSEFHFESEEGIGTRIRLCLPLDKCAWPEEEKAG